MPASTATAPGSDRVSTRKGESVPKFAAINASISGPNTIVAHTSLKSILVMSYVLVVAGDVTVTWESSGGTVHGGPQAFVSNGGIAVPFSQVGHFECVSGEDLVLFLSDAVQVGGHVQYVLI